ncbi:MAG: Fic family protein [Candidatus Peregrinibacteria bacterium]|nr:Fic family protein [Candidatus Peregrinibacteria bacterium]
MTISDKLMIIQRLTGLTQEKLAGKFGVSFVTINSWINGKSVPHLKAQALIDELYKQYTGQKIIPKNVLQAKKELIYLKSKNNKNILKKILNKPDIYDEFLLLLTYHTNSIEGSTLNENETGAILFYDKVLPNKSLVEQMEVKNHKAALQYLLKYLVKEEKITEELILKLHLILMNSIRDDAGFYRRYGVRIVGANVPTANYIKVPDLMEKLTTLINAKKNDIVNQISEVHSVFEKIHPFGDGNGRVGRLIIVAMLLIKNFPPAIIRQENKKLYYTYLNKAQLHEDFSLLEDFLCDAIEDGFDVFGGE